MNVNRRKLVRQRIPRTASGFTLLEMAVVLMIIGLLLGGLIPTLSAQMDVQRSNRTEKQLNEIVEALTGFAAINGRLPCPASSTSNGQESFCSNDTGACTVTTTLPSHGRCSDPYNGLIPAATLGLTPVDSQGFVLDSWNNRIRYAVTAYWDATNNIFSFTSPDGIRTTGLSTVSPNLFVCSTATGISGSACASGASLTSSGVPAIVYSTGINGGSGGTGTDEKANPNPNDSSSNNQTFVSHTPTSSSAANGEFDDIVIWLSPNVLINRMMAAGRLP
jgi:prepilin-type N-terminal cleavage/methylation domain-containing protein